MEIEVRLFATLRDYLPQGSSQFSCKLQVKSTDTVGDVLGKLKVPDETPKIILVNGIHSTLDSVLKPGDVLSVFPPVAGG
jgi:molybdopterin converting factor small subunit